MKAPTGITVAGRPWRIRFVDETKMRDLAPDSDALGLTFGQKLTIYVASWIPGHLQREVLLHEVMHACVFGGQFDGDFAEGTDHEERFVSGLDAPLLTTLRENDHLTTYLLS